MRQFLSKNLLTLATVSTLFLPIISSQPAFSRTVYRVGTSSRPNLPIAAPQDSSTNAAIASGINSTPNHDLIYRGGNTIQNLNFVNFYMGGSQFWSQSDIRLINMSLAAALSDIDLNNVMAQYFSDQQISSAFQGSYFLPVQVPATVSKAEVETWVSNLATNGYLTGFDFSSTAFNFMLPKGTILTYGQDTSQDGLGGFHGSVHVTSSDGRPATLYYVVGVYSEIRSNGQTNGIPAFDQSWKDVAATFYHELNEVRTDPDGEDAGRTGNPSFFGWLSQQGEECGDFPLSGAYSPAQVFQEVPLTNGRGTVPVQFMYSNAVHGPEGPIATPH